MNVPTNAEILCNLITIVNKMNIYKDNDFKHNINKIRVIIDNNVMNKTDKEIIHNFIKNKIDIKKNKQPKKHTDYQVFVKKNMKDINNQYPVNERKKALSFLWKEWKENRMDIDE